jgi:hypothetical protein
MAIGKRRRQPKQTSHQVVNIHLMFWIPVTIATLCVTVAMAGCDASSVRRPLSRSTHYRGIITEYTAATVLPSEVEKEYGNRIWKQLLPEDSPVRGIVTGRAQNDVIQVGYPDESKARQVFPPKDYTNNLEVRAKGSTLYVYRAVTLLWTEYRLAVYDLTNRKMRVDLLVAPEDMPPAVEGR